jgi:hypothetical protein
MCGMVDRVCVVFLASRRLETYLGWGSLSGLVSERPFEEMGSSGRMLAMGCDKFVRFGDVEWDQWSIIYRLGDGFRWWPVIRDSVELSFLLVEFKDRKMMFALPFDYFRSNGSLGIFQPKY